MKRTLRSFLVLTMIAGVAFVLHCGGGGGTATQFDSQDLNDHSAEIQQNSDNAELVFVGTITAVGTAPGFWSGIAMSTQPVIYDVDEVLKGTYTESEITISHLVVEGSRQASTEEAGLNTSIFVAGGQLIVFAKQNAGYVSLGTDYEGPENIDVDPEYGTIPYSSQNQGVVEGMIANPTAQVAAAAAEYEGAGEAKGYYVGKTLTVNGAAADQTSWNDMLNECSEMSSTLSDLVSMIQNSETYTVTVNLGRNQAGVFVDSWNDKSVDLDDIEAFTDLDGCDGQTGRCQLFVHILQEYWHAAVTGDGYEPSHASALQSENQVRSDLGKATTLTGHFGMRSGGNLYMQTTYGGNTELVQIINGSNVGPTTVRITPPAAPSGLAADNSQTCRIILTWTDNSDNETGFSLERKTGAGGTWEQIYVGQIGAGTTTWTNAAADDPSLVWHETYCYRIRAYRAVDSQFEYSSYSNEVCTTKE